MKLIPIHRYKKKIQKMTDEALDAEWEKALTVRDNSTYVDACTEELSKRGLI